MGDTVEISKLNTYRNELLDEIEQKSTEITEANRQLRLLLTIQQTKTSRLATGKKTKTKRRKPKSKSKKQKPKSKRRKPKTKRR